MATNNESKVLDPFAGSSTTGIAANIVGRSFTGIEKEKAFYEMSIARKNELDANRDTMISKIKDLELLSKTP